MDELLRVFIDNIAPILLVAAIGFLVGRRFCIDPKPLGRIIFNVFSPALVFRALATNNVSLAEFGQLLLVMLVFVSLMALVATVLVRWQSQDRVERAGLILSVICPNNGNLGLPLADFAFGPAVLARATIIYVITTILNYTLGVYVASSGNSQPRLAIANVLRMPAVYAVGAGLFLNGIHGTMPVVISRTIDLLAQATIPCMLILLGLQLAQSTEIRSPRIVITSVTLRLLIAPLVAAALVLLLRLHGPAATAFIMQASMPVAVVTVIFATEFNLNREQVLSSILASTFISPVTLSVLIVLLRAAQ